MGPIPRNRMRQVDILGLRPTTQKGSTTTTYKIPFISINFTSFSPETIKAPPMRYSSFLVLLWGLLGCAHTATQSPVVVAADALELHPQEGRFYHQGEPFTGIGETHYPAGQRAAMTTYQAGKKQGQHQKWFETGTLSYQCHYEGNKLHGEAKSWWTNGRLRTVSRYAYGVGEGLQEQWYRTGERFKRLQLHKGKELGLQQAWRKNGTLYSNYEVKNGKIYGLKKAGLCYELDQEEVVYAQ